jgi:ribulose-phosphate 3-epimerase
MVTIVGINCPDFGCVRKRWDAAATLGARTIQIDVADGAFAPAKTWANPAEFSELVKKNPEIEAEIHLMVEKPELVFEGWLKAGAKKLVVHFESGAKSMSLIRKAAKDFYGAETIIGIGPTTNIEEIVKSENLNLNFSVQLVAVPLGFSGGEFDRSTPSKIKYIKNLWPNVKIIVDGGMNPQTAEQVKDAGADAIVAVSYIWENDSPAEAYQELIKV